MIQENCCGYDINIILPDDYNIEKQYPALFLNDGNQIKLWNKHNCNYIIFGIIPNDRLENYTPWKSDAIRENAPDFGGEANEYIKVLVNGIIPELRKKYNVIEEKMIFGGISLGGLAAVYSLFHTTRFPYIFSICGSFWYPNFSSYIMKEEILNKSAHAYIINGLEEGKNYNNILEEAPQKAKIVQDQLKAKIDHCICVFDNYGHHDNMEKRIEEVQRWIEDNIN